MADRLHALLRSRLKNFLNRGSTHIARLLVLAVGLAHASLLSYRVLVGPRIAIPFALSTRPFSYLIVLPPFLRATMQHPSPMFLFVLTFSL